MHDGFRLWVSWHYLNDWNVRALAQTQCLAFAVRQLAAVRLRIPDEGGILAFSVHKFAFDAPLGGSGWIEAKIS